MMNQNVIAGNMPQNFVPYRRHSTYSTHSGEFSFRRLGFSIGASVNLIGQERYLVSTNKRSAIRGHILIIE